MTPGPAVLAGDGRDGGMLTGILAILVFLTLLVAAFGLGIAGAAHLVDRQGERLTVQVAVAEADRALAVLRAAPAVARAIPVDRAALLRRLRPWLGDDPVAAGVPIPALIDVDLRDPAAADDVAAGLGRQVAAIRIDRADHWLAPVARLLHLLMLVAGLLVALLVAAIGGGVLIATRRALARHRDTIAVMHALGATDRQLAALLRRPIARSVLAGAAIGSAGALVIVLAVETTATALGSALTAGTALRLGDWAVLAAIPPALAALAIGTAQRITAAALGRLA